jgi:hypothetical protein
MEAKLKLDSVLEKQRKRYLLLLRIYELTDGDERKILMLETPEGLDENEVMTIVDYLSGEGLVQHLADEAPLIRISHQGVVEVEQSLLNPQGSTEHFAAPVIQHYHGNVGSVQTGNAAVANVTQNIGDREISDLLKQLRQHLADEPEASREGNELVDGLQAEVKANSPNRSRVRLYLKGLETFVKDSGKNLLVEIASKVISNQIGLP